MVVLFTCRVVGRQPPVVGEMVAGVVLGPSALGALLPAVEAELFPRELRPVLYVVMATPLLSWFDRRARVIPGRWSRSLPGITGTAGPVGAP